MNPQHPDLESGALSIRATGLYQNYLFGFPMQFMPPAKLAVFFHFQTVLHGPLVFRRVVVPAFAFRAGQGNDVSHSQPTLTALEPTTRIELVTSSLPRMCSTD